jgi:hypothetical protein
VLADTAACWCRVPQRASSAPGMTTRDSRTAAGITPAASSTPNVIGGPGYLMLYQSDCPHSARSPFYRPRSTTSSFGSPGWASLRAWAGAWVTSGLAPPSIPVGDNPGYRSTHMTHLIDRSSVRQRRRCRWPSACPNEQSYLPVREFSRFPCSSPPRTPEPGKNFPQNKQRLNTW